MEVTEISLKTYTDLLKNTENGWNLFQSPAYIRMRESNGASYKIVLGSENGIPVFALIVYEQPAMKIFKSGISFRGWVPLRDPADLFDEKLVSEFVSKTADLLKKSGLIAWILESGIELRKLNRDGSISVDGFQHLDYRTMLERCGFTPRKLWRGYCEIRQSRYASAIDLADVANDGLPVCPAYASNYRTLDQHLRSMPGNQRRRMAEKDYIEVIECGEEGVPVLKEQLDKSASWHDFVPLPEARLADFIRAFESDGKLYQVRLNVPAYRRHLEDQIVTASAEIPELKEALELNPRLKKKKAALKEAQRNLEEAAGRIRQLDELNLKNDTEVLASGLFLFTPYEAYYLIGGSDRRLSMFNGPYLMQRAAITECLKRGVIRYNLWGISGHFEEDQPGYGVFRFKELLGAVPLEYAGLYTMPLKFPGKQYLDSLESKDLIFPADPNPECPEILTVDSPFPSQK